MRTYKKKKEKNNKKSGEAYCCRLRRIEASEGGVCETGELVPTRSHTVSWRPRIIVIIVEILSLSLRYYRRRYDIIVVVAFKKIKKKIRLAAAYKFA